MRAEKEEEEGTGHYLWGVAAAYAAVETLQRRRSWRARDRQVRVDGYGRAHGTR